MNKTRRNANMKPQSTHTPTPWHSDLSTVHGPEIDAEYQEKQIVCSVINKADAAFIVRAVNAHEELIAMSKGLLGYATSHGMSDDLFLKYQAVIARAEGK
jgi:hypothetical protein